MRLATATVLSTLILGMPAAHAADALLIPTSVSDGMAAAVDPSSSFDWSGFYAGVFGGARTDPAGASATFGVNAGVNAQFDFVLVGAEIAVQGLPGSSTGTSYGQILGRAGLIVTDDVAVYAAGGYGIDLGLPNEQDLLLGGGVELAVTDAVSLRAQYQRSFPVDSGVSTDQFTFGAQYSF